MASCCSCGAAAAKYRCRCAARYCSSACFKLHGPACPSASEPQAPRKAPAPAPAAAAAAAQASPPPAPAAPLSAPQVTVTEAQLRRLAADEGVRRALRSAELQKIVRSVDGAADRGRELERYLALNPDFRAFTNDVLRAIGHESGAITVPQPALAAAASAEARIAHLLAGESLPP